MENGDEGRFSKWKMRNKKKKMKHEDRFNFDRTSTYSRFILLRCIYFSLYVLGYFGFFQILIYGIFSRFAIFAKRKKSVFAIFLNGYFKIVILLVDFCLFTV